MDSSSSLRQQQKLKQRLLPQQVQFARLLELTDREVEEEIKRELEENPALERTDTETDHIITETTDQGPRYYAPARTADPDAPDPGSLAVARAATLPELLRGQLAELHLDPDIRHLAEFMTDSLDSNGYFTRTVPQMATDAAMIFDHAPTPDQAREAWRVIRTLDPPGIGAMDLRDCLLLQLLRLPDSTPYVESAREVVRHYFDLFSRRNFSRLAEESGLSTEELRGANDLIVTLNPKPAASISAESDTEPSAGITPDFIVETDSVSGRATVSMANTLPSLAVEQSFRLADDAPQTETNDFIRLCAGEARSFIDMLKRRQRTLMAIATAIVRIQSDFFVNGDDESRIRPMVLRDVAAATGMDMSTVSRATAGKWLATPFGVYELKKFFNEPVADTSSREIMAALREIVESEDQASPIGDDDLTEALAARGYKVARRTVAKYRDRLGIPPARLRRKL